MGSPAPVNATISQYCGYEEDYPYKLDSSEAAKHAHGRVTPFVTVADLTVRFAYAARGDPRAAVCTRETIRVHSQTELVLRFGSSQLVSTRFAFQSSTSNTCVLPSSTARLLQSPPGPGKSLSFQNTRNIARLKPSAVRRGSGTVTESRFRGARAPASLRPPPTVS